MQYDRKNTPLPTVLPISAKSLYPMYRMSKKFSLPLQNNYFLYLQRVAKTHSALTQRTVNLFPRWICLKGISLSFTLCRSSFEFRPDFGGMRFRVYGEIPLMLSQQSQVPLGLSQRRMKVNKNISATSKNWKYPNPDAPCKLSWCKKTQTKKFLVSNPSSNFSPNPSSNVFETFFNCFLPY